MYLSENRTSSSNSSLNIRKHKTQKLSCGRGLTSWKTVWISAAKKEKAEIQATGMSEKCTRPTGLLINNNHKEQGFTIECRKLLRLCLDFIIFRSRVIFRSSHESQYGLKTSLIAGRWLHELLSNIDRFSNFFYTLTNGLSVQTYYPSMW